MKMFTIRLFLRSKHFNCLFSPNVYLIKHNQIFVTLENYYKHIFFISFHKFNIGSAHLCAVYSLINHNL